MYRLFVAIDPPESIRVQLGQICFGLPGAKWVDRSQMHITLKFIGEVDGAVFRRAQEVLDTIRLDPFEMAISGLGFFPPRGDPQLLWAGVEANVKETPPPKVAQYLCEYGTFRLPPFEVEAFSLYSSFLSHERAIHQVEVVYQLKGNRREVS